MWEIALVLFPRLFMSFKKFGRCLMRDASSNEASRDIMHNALLFCDHVSRAVVVPRSLLFNKNSLYFGFSSILLAKISSLVIKIRKLFSNLVVKTLETQNCKKTLFLFIIFYICFTVLENTILICLTRLIVRFFSPRQTRIDEIMNLYNFLYLICLYYYIYTCYIKIYILLKRKITKFFNTYGEIRTFSWYI